MSQRPHNITTWFTFGILLFISVGSMIWVNNMLTREVASLVEEQRHAEPIQHNIRPQFQETKPAIPIIDPLNDPLAPVSRKNKPALEILDEQLKHDNSNDVGVYEIPTDNTILLQ